MSDGGVKMYRINSSYRNDLNMRYQTATAVASLKAIYDTSEPFVYVAFPDETVGQWEGEDIYLVNWTGDWDFKQAAGNSPDTQGYNGNIRLAEVPK
jgi:hypothetical protein